MGKRVEQQQECFLCVLDPHHSCAVLQLDGRIVNSYERRINGETLPFITLYQENADIYVSLELTQYHRNFVKELSARGKQSIRNLVLRVYHLPTEPDIAENTDHPLHRYKANPYTLTILEPDILLNITDLNQATYCSRQYLLNSLISSGQSAATIRGNLVHHCFKELLKEHDRGELMTNSAMNGHETALETLQRHLEQKMAQSSIDLALANVSDEAIREDVAPHLDSLATWFEKQKATLWDLPVAYMDDKAEETEQQSRNQVRAETFLLSPEIGLRGRLDLFWQKAGHQRLLELKTGGKENLPRQAHRWQVYGYHSLLTVRRDSQMKKALGTLLYSGTPDEAQAFGIPFSVKDLQRVCETRNILLLSHVTGIPTAPPGPRQCTKCAMLQQCSQVSTLLNWQPPEPDISTEIPHAHGTDSDSDLTQYIQKQPLVTDEQRTFFKHYFTLLQLEGRAIEQQLALLWKEPVEERVKRGATLQHLVPIGKPEPTSHGEWEQLFACENTSELREGDEILLSDGNPITGEVMTGTITSISVNTVKVWSPEKIANPRLIDRYETNLVHTRTIQNLLRWLNTDAHLQGLVAGTIRPRFSANLVSPRADFNTEQNLAVERAVQMQD
ncbi:MAG: PD-(D/E)XK nuclease family protein, partial [Chloroflexota bacterium]|nr:PD-(D/E)XK nuclease family protein [Chloroflexota bacterium]